MENNIKEIINDVYVARNFTSKKICGGISAVTVNAGSEAAAKGQKIKSKRIAPPTITKEIVPSMTVPTPPALDVETDEMELKYEVSASMAELGEEELSLKNSGHNELTLRQGFIAEAIKSIVTIIEEQVGEVVAKGACQAIGTPGINPFATDMKLLNRANTILLNNGAGEDTGTRSCVINPTTFENLANQDQNQDVSKSGSNVLIERGLVSSRFGMFIKKSAGIYEHTKGTATGFDLNGSPSIGDTTVNVDGSNSGTILPGDLISWGGGENKYVVNSASASGASSGNIIFNNPGLVTDLTDTTEGVIQNNYFGNYVLERSAVELAIRPYMVPKKGDAALFHIETVDQETGLAFTLSSYKGYLMNRLEIKAIYGIKVWRPEWVVSLIA